MNTVSPFERRKSQPVLHFSGGLPVLLVVAMGALLVTDAIHLHAIPQVSVCLFGNIAFSFGVVSWFTVICLSLSETSKRISNALSCTTIVCYMAAFPGILNLYDWILHILVALMVLWYLWRDYQDYHEHKHLR